MKANLKEHKCKNKMNFIKNSLNNNFSTRTQTKFMDKIVMINNIVTKTKTKNKNIKIKSSIVRINKIVNCMKIKIIIIMKKINYYNNKTNYRVIVIDIINLNKIKLKLINYKKNRKFMRMMIKSVKSLKVFIYKRYCKLVLLK